MRGFVDELEKIAKHEFYSEIKDLRKTLEPGDILVTQPRPEAMEGKYFQQALRPFLKAFQGTDYTHAGLYVGDGTVIDSGIWKNRSAEVASVPLEDYTKRYQFRVLRVKASPEEKQDAVEYAKRQKGKPFGTLKMLRMALPVMKTVGKRVREEAAQTLFCSELVANAYHNQNFAAERHIQHVRPVDIQRSPLTKIVAEYK